MSSSMTCLRRCIKIILPTANFLKLQICSSKRGEVPLRKAAAPRSGAIEVICNHHKTSSDPRLLNCACASTVVLFPCKRGQFSSRVGTGAPQPDQVAVPRLERARQRSRAKTRRCAEPRSSSDWFPTGRWSRISPRRPPRQRGAALPPRRPPPQPRTRPSS